MKKTLYLFAILFFAVCNNSYAQDDRRYWTDLAYKMARPVLENMSKGKLKKNMPLEVSPDFGRRDKASAYLEAFGRLMAGIAPWLSLPDDDTAEGKKRQQLRAWALQSYKNAVDDNNPDRISWNAEQNIVDSAYLAESFLRGYDSLWLPLDEITKQKYIERFISLRRFDPPYTNWILLMATIESFLAKVDTSFDKYRIDTTFRKMEEWYVGDGLYSDGPDFAFNYYNSHVFHPMYLETLQVMIEKRVHTRLDYPKYYQRALKRAQRYAVLLERFIAPDGTFPVFGRSITYRSAVFQPLAFLALEQKLPEKLPNGQVRAAMTSVLHKMYDHNKNFNKEGFLELGFYGHQPNIADAYTNTGSLYIASQIFLPLGLPAEHDFWTAPAQNWTQLRAWSGEDFPRDDLLEDDKHSSDKW